MTAVVTPIRVHSPDIAADAFAAPGDIDMNAKPSFGALGVGHLDAAAIEPWTHLVATIAEVDQNGAAWPAEHLRQDLGGKFFDAQKDSWTLWDGDDLIAVARVDIRPGTDSDNLARVSIKIDMHPEYRGRGLGERLMDVAEARAAQLTAKLNPGVDYYIRMSGGMDGHPVRDLLEERGYAPVRYFHEMIRPLPGTQALPERNTGVTVVGLEPHMSPPLRRVHNEAFNDHWGTPGYDEASWQEMLSSPLFIPEMSTVTLDDDGVPRAYALCGQWAGDDLEIMYLGTRRDSRRLGLGRACLVETLHRAVADGRWDQAILEVDTDSPSGAGDLYDWAGFSTVRTFAVYRRLCRAIPTT